MEVAGGVAVDGLEPAGAAPVEVPEGAVCANISSALDACAAPQTTAASAAEPKAILNDMSGLPGLAGGANPAGQMRRNSRPVHIRSRRPALTQSR